MTFPPTYSYPNIQDYRGNRFRPGTTCYRRGYSSVATQSDLDKCFCWKIKEPDDGSHLRLVSRPSGLDIALSYDAARYLVVYNEFEGLAPEKFPEQYHRLIDMGWEIWVEDIRLDYQAHIHGYNLAHNLQIKIEVSLHEFNSVPQFGELTYEYLIAEINSGHVFK